MRRHPIDQASAVLGIVAVALGIAVMSGAGVDHLDSHRGSWVAAAALLLGVGLIPWRRRSPRVDQTLPDTD